MNIHASHFEENIPIVENPESFGKWTKNRETPKYDSVIDILKCKKIRALLPIFVLHDFIILLNKRWYNIAWLQIVGSAGSSRNVGYNYSRKKFANNMADMACKNVSQMFENSEIQTQMSQYITLIIS